MPALARSTICEGGNRCPLLSFWTISAFLVRSTSLEPSQLECAIRSQMPLTFQEKKALIWPSCSLHILHRFLSNFYHIPLRAPLSISLGFFGVKGHSHFWQTALP